MHQSTKINIMSKQERKKMQWQEKERNTSLAVIKVIIAFLALSKQ